jgi:hypothetical protein
VKPSISKKTIWGFPQMGVPPNHPKSDHFSIETHGGLGIFGGINIHLPAILWYLGCTVLTHNRLPCIGMAMMTERRVPAAKKVKKSAPRSPAVRTKGVLQQWQVKA